jgi:lipoprotein signal peptidase
MASEYVPGPGNSRADIGEPADGGRARRRWLLTAVIPVLIGIDQVVKWLAWRHLDGSLINDGGYILLGPVIRSWFAGPAGGAVADVLGTVLVVLGIGWLLLRCRPLYVLIGGALVSAGWASNLLDRLGMHHWTAPGSARGVVDFIPSGGSSACNVADLFIAVGTVLLAYGIARSRLTDRPRDGLGPRSAQRPGRTHPKRRRVVAALALLIVVTLAVTSAMNHNGAHSPTSLR